jgi:hypothetical protein
MATRAVHFAFPQGVVGEAHLLADLLFVAGIAGVHDSWFGEEHTGGTPGLRMHHVAIDTADVPYLMRASLPEKTRFFLMTLNARLIAAGSRSRRGLLEANHVPEFLPVRISMVLRRSMACFAHQRLGRIPRMLREQDSHGCLLEPLGDFFMTAFARLVVSSVIFRL